MIITPEDLPNLEKEIKNLKKCMLFMKCLEDRDAGKVKHCYENDRRWRSIGLEGGLFIEPAHGTKPKRD